MSSAWQTVVLSEIVSKLGDGLHGTPKYSENGDYHFINGNNLVNGRIVFNEKTKRVDETQYSKYKKELNNHTLLVSINGTIGNIAYYRGEKVVLGKSACYFNLNDNINKHFVRYVLDSRSFQMYIESQATGTTIKNVSLKTMRNFEFKLPPIEEQKSIAHILGTLDDKIELNRKMNDILEQMSQALFKSWFVDFDPVLDNALALGNSIPDALKPKAEQRKEVISSGKYKALPKELMELFPSSFVFNDELEKWIPEEWRVEHLGEISEKISKGTTPRKADVEGKEEIVPFIKVRDLDDFGNISGDLDLIPKDVHVNQLKRSVLRTSDLLFSIAGTIGRVAIVNDELDFSNCNQAIAFIRLKTPSQHQILVHQNLRSDYVQGLINSKVVQAVQANASLKNISEIPIVICHNEILNIFNSRMKLFYERLSASKSETNSLVKQRDVLLPQLISGKLSVEDLKSEVI